MLEWNVFVGDFNAGEIVIENIFEHGYFFQDCQKNYRENRKDKAAFLERLAGDLMYWFWSKAEWEIIIDHWVGRNDAKSIKVDAYDQVFMNWSRFSEYVWEHKHELRPPSVRKKNEATVQ